MKKLLLLVAALITLSANSQTSVYHPFPEDSATWCASMCGLQGNAFNDATYQLSGKVLINGNWYNRMYDYERSCYGAGFCVCAQLTGASTTTYYIRQDTAQKKVWIYVPSTNSDTIFLDFNLNVGDTIDGRKAYWAQLFNFSEPVSSIDSVLIGTQYRTQYNYLYQGYPNSMIEGIGPTHGFFYEANIGYDHVQDLRLFTQNNQIFYPYYLPDTTGMGQLCHDFTAGIEEPEQIAYSISPNPSPGKFTIRFAQYLSKVSIEIYNSIGEKVWNENICNESKKEIKLNNISNGIYFVKVFDGERSYCKKLIIEYD